MSITMLALPLIPTLVAVAALLSCVFILFKMYDEDWKYAVMGTVAMIVISAAAFFVTLGVMTFGGI